MSEQLLEKVNLLKGKVDAAIASAKSTGDIEKIRVEVLGKNGNLTLLMRELKSLTAEEKRNIGVFLNDLKKYIDTQIQEKNAEFFQKEEENKIEQTESYDGSIEGILKMGSYHPITLVQREVEEIFQSMGFIVEEFAEIVDEYSCFESLNIPKHHPARDMQDTYYLSTGQVLKTHTSAAQNAIMKKYGPPLRAVFPGRCFRNESLDACHENTFFQMEGIMIDENISISNLIYFMKTMLSEVFEREVKVRLRPGFFPFVEPGFELDIQCLICGGEGCPSCKDSGWLELCPCGMIHPYVLKEGGIDPDQYTGFAFGLGLTRLAMMKYGIQDIRVFNSGNLKSLTQFQ